MPSHWLEALLKLFIQAGEQRAGKSGAHMEVERKFRLTEEECSNIPQLLLTRGFSAAGEVIMTDTFLPTAVEGDMARVREECESGKRRTLLTLKTWVATADGGKERKETEREISPLSGKLLLAAGRLAKQSALLFFSKSRNLFAGKLDGCDTVVSIDHVDSLGEYSGRYLEIEIIVPVGAEMDSARERISKLAGELFGETREPVALSYMQMLKRSQKTS